MQRARGVVLRGVVVVAVVVLVIAVAGCSAFDDGTDNEGDATPPPEQTPTAASTPSPGQTPTGESPTNGGTSAAFDVSILNATETAVAGEPVTIGIEVENVGGAAGTGTISLGNATESVELAPNGSVTVALTWSAPDPGSHELTVASANDTETATVEVLEAAPEFAVAIAEVDGPVPDRDPLGVTVDVSNEGTVAATQTVNLTAGDTVVNSTTVTLDRGESETRTLVWGTATPHGERELRVTSANDSASTTVTVEPIEEPAVAGQVSVMNGTIPAESGTVHLYEIRSGERVDAAELAPDGEFRFGRLEPGREYRLEIPAARATHPEIGETVGGPDAFPTTEHTFTAKSVQQSADLVYGYEIRGADSYRWEFYKDRPDDNRFEGYGRYTHREAYVFENQTAGIGAEITRQVIYLENTTFYNTSKSPAPVWYEKDETWHPPTTKPHRIVQDPSTEFITLDRTFRGEVIVDRNPVHKYDISGLKNYPSATVYVNPETGHVVKWESKYYYRNGADGYRFNDLSEIVFSNHNDESITVEAPR
jgi:hypothetical protein